MELIEPEEVTIKFSCLEDNKISADHYILMHWKYFGNYSLPKLVEYSMLDEKFDIEYLEQEGFIKITDIDNNQFELRQKAINLFKSSSLEKKWLEFLNTFPIKVSSRNGGTRPLKISNPNSKVNKKISIKYIKLIKNNPDLHFQIIKVLNAEMEMRRKSNEMQYMHNMETWLNQEDYNKYSYLVAEEDNYENEDYM